MSQILFVGGGLDSTDPASANIGEITGFNDATYAPSAVDCNSGQASWAIFTCLDAALAPTTVVGGQVFYGHFGWNHTNPYVGGDKMLQVRDSAGAPWVAIRSVGGTPNFGLFYNSGTVGAPVWTQIGAGFALAQNPGGAEHRIDIAIQIGATGNHTATVFDKEISLTTANFTQALFTNVRDMQIFAGGVGANHCMICEVIMTEGRTTVGARVGYSLPNGAGTNAGWTGTFNLVNPVVCTDATNNNSAVAAQKTTYAMGDIVVPALNTIGGVWHWTRGKNDGASPANFKSVCRSAAADFPAAANVPSIGLAYRGLAARWDVDPATAAAWTQANFNAAEFGWLSAA
jgi:hypothetical protein